MSRAGLDALVDRLAEDPSLMAELVARIGRRAGDEAILAIINVGARHGFEIQFAEARALQAQLRARDAAPAGDAEAEERDLDDEELQAASGGITAPGAAVDPALVERLPRSLAELLKRG